MLLRGFKMRLETAIYRDYVEQPTSALSKSPDSLVAVLPALRPLLNYTEVSQAIRILQQDH